MRWRTAILGLILSVGVIGCQGPPQATEKPVVVDTPHVPTPAPIEPVGAVPPTLTEPAPTQVDQTGPPVDDTAAVICEPASGPGWLEVSHRREGALLDALASRLQSVTVEGALAVISDTAGCLKPSPVTGSSNKLLWVALRPKEYDKDMFAVWYFGGVWRAVHLPVDEYRTIPYPNWYRETPDGPEVVALGRNGGSGHVGSYMLMRFGTEMKVLWQTPLYDHLTDRSPNDHLLMATYRDRTAYDETHAYWANCCRPTNGQTLWERQGDTFVEKAVRAYPSPLRAVSAFVGAWNEGRFTQAANYAAKESVISAMMSDVPKVPTIELGPEPPNLAIIEETEEAYWEAVPSEFRGPEPTLMELVWHATPRSLLLKRIQGEWRVAGWHQ